MRDPLPLEDFAALARVPAAQIEGFRAAGLLDPDRDGLYDDFDALRLQYIQVHLDLGLSLDQIVEGIRSRSSEISDFEALLFSSGGALTPEDAAEMTGVPSEVIQALRMASGLPGTTMHELDLESFGGVKAMIEMGIPIEALLEGARVWGDAMRRVAETEVGLIHRFVHEPLTAAGLDEREVAKQHKTLMEAIQPLTEVLLQYVHRQYILRSTVADVLQHLRSAASPERPSTLEATILFVDLSSFTALAQVHGDEEAAAVLDRFDGLVRTLVHQHHGTLVKQIGDAFMLTFAEPDDAVRFAVALDAAAAREERFPALRMGIHTGPVLYRVGDYIGTTVNLASRVATAAMPNEILMTEVPAKASEKDGVPIAEVGVRVLRGVEEPLTLYRVMRSRDPAQLRDPVCGMLVADAAAARLEWAGVSYAFCSPECLRKFVETPGKYATG
jgi:class 3 adenylate cyclase